MTSSNEGLWSGSISQINHCFLIMVFCYSNINPNKDRYLPNFLERVSHQNWNSLIKLGWLAEGLWLRACLCRGQNWNYRHVWDAQVATRVLDLNSCLHDCTARALSQGWRDGSQCITCCSCRGPRFNSQQPHGTL